MTKWVKVELDHDMESRQFSLKIDGREMSAVRSYEIKATVDEIPTITLTLVARELVVNGVYHPAFNTLDSTSESVRAAIVEHDKEKVDAQAEVGISPH